MCPQRHPCRYVLMKRKANANHDAAEPIAIGVLGWLVEDEDRILAFLQSTGLSPDNLREAAHDPGFLAAVLDHVMSDEAGLIACAGAIGEKPERIAAAWQRLRPPEFDHEA